MGFPGESDGKESTCNTENLGSIFGLGRSPGGGLGNPLHHCSELITRTRSPSWQRRAGTHREGQGNGWADTAAARTSHRAMAGPPRRVQGRPGTGPTGAHRGRNSTEVSSSPCSLEPPQYQPESLALLHKS